MTTTKPLSKKHLVFVYGSLRRAHGNHALLRAHDAIPAGDASTLGYVLHDLGAFPGARPGARTDSILGELYRVDREGLAALDHLEGVASGFYERKRVRVFRRDDGPGPRVLHAWLYVLGDGYACDERHPVIACGDWTAHRTIIRV